MKECFCQIECLEVFWQQVSFLGYFLDLIWFLFFVRGEREQVSEGGFDSLS